MHVPVLRALSAIGIGIGILKAVYTRVLFFVQTQIIGYYLIPHVTFLEGSAIGIGMF